GGVYTGFGQYSTLNAINTIIAGNDRYDVSNYVHLVSNGHNIFGQASVPGSIAGDRVGIASVDIFATLNPNGLGGALGDNGGPTLTIALRDDPSNPALNGGATGTGIPTLDQRGLVCDGTPDIGAFELHGVLFTAAADTQNLNLFDLTRFPGAEATDALAGSD